MRHFVLCIHHIDKCSDSLLNPWVHSFVLVHQNSSQKINQSKYNYHSFMSCDWCQRSDKTFSIKLKMFQQNKHIFMAKKETNCNNHEKLFFVS